MDCQDQRDNNFSVNLSFLCRLWISPAELFNEFFRKFVADNYPNFFARIVDWLEVGKGCRLVDCLANINGFSGSFDYLGRPKCSYGCPHYSRGTVFAIRLQKIIFIFGSGCFSNRTDFFWKLSVLINDASKTLFKECKIKKCLIK